MENLWNGEMLTPMHTVSSVRNQFLFASQEKVSDGTQVTMVSDVTSEYARVPPFRAPGAPLTLSRFAKPFRERKGTLNFRASLVGIVCDVQPVECSQNGAPKQAFKFVDTEGFWISCWAHGYHAGGPALKQGMHVYLYGGSGRGAIGSDEPAVRVLKDGFLYPLKQKVVFQGPRTQIRFS